MSSEPFRPASLQISHMVAGAVLLVVLVLSGIAFWSRSQLNREIIQVQNQITAVTTQREDLRLKQLDALILAQETSTRVKSTRFVWSNILTNLVRVTPLDVFYRSYSASTDGKLSVSVFTDSYESAAELISILKKEPKLSDVFVSSLTRGQADSGSDVVSFGLTFLNVR